MTERWGFRIWTDPKAKAKILRLSAQRVEGLIFRNDSAIAWVNDAAVEKLKEYDTEAEAASKAEIVAAEKFRAGAPLLAGTGEKVWKPNAPNFEHEQPYLSASRPYWISFSE